jgi:asparagine synthetase A
MKIFNKTYLLKTSKIQTIRMIDFIYRELLTKLNDEFNLITVSPPLFDKINSPSLLEFNGVNRPINIDFIEEYQIITFYQSLSR